MTDPLVPEIVHLRHGMRAVYISRELLALTRRTEGPDLKSDPRKETDK